MEKIWSSGLFDVLHLRHSLFGNANPLAINPLSGKHVFGKWPSGVGDDLDYAFDCHTHPSSWLPEASKAAHSRLFPDWIAFACLASGCIWTFPSPFSRWRYSPFHFGRYGWIFSRHGPLAKPEILQDLPCLQRGKSHLLLKRYGLNLQQRLYVVIAIRNCALPS